MFLPFTNRSTKSSRGSTELSFALPFIRVFPFLLFPSRNNEVGKLYFTFSNAT
jgi:hypothetical protein